MWFINPTFTVIGRTQEILECETINGRNPFLVAIPLVFVVLFWDVLGFSVPVGIGALILPTLSQRWVFDRSNGFIQRSFLFTRYPVFVTRYPMGSVRGMRIRKSYGGGEAAGTTYVLELLRRRSRIYVASRRDLVDTVTLAEDIKKYLPQSVQMNTSYQLENLWAFNHSIDAPGARPNMRL